MNSILIIEDDAPCRRSMVLILTMEGFSVDIAINGADGLSKIREKRPDLILCDITMPEMDGHSLLDLVKSDSSIADIPFIFVSAMDDRADVRFGMSKGADDYLTKPFTVEELISTVVSRLQRVEVFRQSNEKTAVQKDFAALRQRITARELEVLVLVGRGMTSREIAGRLKISIYTVDVHRANLMRKLDAPNAASLSRWIVVAEQMTASD
jgi:DNA-binding NarL/FixJ family response regulator